MANKNIKNEIHIISYREIRITTLRRYLFIPIRVAIIFLKKKGDKFWQGCRKLESSHIVDRSIKWCSHCGKQWLGNRIIIWPSNFISAQKELKAELQIDIWAPTSIAALLMLVERCQQPKCQLWVNEKTKWSMYKQWNTIQL